CTDGIELVPGGDLEADDALVDGRHAYADLDRAAGQRRRQVFDRHLHAHRILAGIGVLQNEVAARELDIADQPRRGVDPGVLAHEADGAVAVDGDALDGGHTGLKAWFHGFSYCLWRSRLAVIC